MPDNAIITSAARCQPFTIGASRMMASQMKQANKCAQKTCKEAWPIITSGRIATAFITERNCMSNAAIAAKSINRTIPRCHLSKEI